MILIEVRTWQSPNAKLVEGWLGLLAQIIESYKTFCKPLWQVWLQFFFFLWFLIIMKEIKLLVNVKKRKEKTQPNHQQKVMSTKPLFYRPNKIHRTLSITVHVITQPPPPPPPEFQTTKPSGPLFNSSFPATVN